MRWQLGRRSQNVEDRRGGGSRGGFPIPGGIRMSRGARRGGLGGIGLIVFVLIAMFLGVDPSMLFQGSTVTTEPDVAGPPPGDELGEFVSVVLADTEDTWHVLFDRMDGTYREPTLVLFSGQVSSACGFASAALGPFYCPADQKVYIDLSFYRDLRERFRAPGDFAQAYVIAHEVGHHVQNLLGLAQQVQKVRGQLGETEANALSVMMELQADCFAGIWAHHAQRARQILEQGDLEEGLNAAAAIGDDRMQRRAQGYVVPDAFTHGSSAQRVRWFREGLATGDLQACDTFNAGRL
ncbi:MAG: KPN_02809 family neutral zinc metallopeptidase [Geminicoccaceae bacterium]